MNVTLNQAKMHLAGLRKLAVEENKYLACVRSYLMAAEVDIVGAVRADQFSSHSDIRDLYDEVDRTEKLVTSFLTEV